MKVGFIGLGKVGKALYDVFSEFHTTCFYDINYLSSRIEDVLDTDIIFISVPTPSTVDDNCDISIVSSVIDSLHKLNYKGVICIKSTVIVGTTGSYIDKYNNANIVFSPEFLKERQAYNDIKYNTNVCIIGSSSDSAFSILCAVYQPLNYKFLKMTPTEAEMTKYFQNVYNTQKILFANAFYEVCKNSNVNYSNVIDAIESRGLDVSYLQCNDKLRGPGGACLPKDTRAFNAYVNSLQMTVKTPGLFQTMVDDMTIYKETCLD